MTERLPSLVLLAVAALAAGAVAVIVPARGPLPADTRDARQFQQLVGGLGFGPSMDLAHCPETFDPRVRPRWTGDLDPLPGNRADPCQAQSILAYPPLPPGS